MSFPACRTPRPLRGSLPVRLRFGTIWQLAGTASAMRIKAGARTAAAESNLELGYELYRNVVEDAVNHFELTAEAVADRCLPLAHCWTLSRRQP